MPPFVAKRRQSSSEEESKIHIDERDSEIAVLVMAKRVGLSFEELKEFSLDDFFAYYNIYTDSLRGYSEGTREATQQDIDNFYSTM